MESMNRICFYFECYYVGGMDTFTIQLINSWNPEDELTLMCNKSHSGAKFFNEKITNPRCKVEIHDMPMVSDWEQSVKNKTIARIMHVLSFLFLLPYYILYGYKRLKLNRFDYLQIVNGGYPAGISCRGIAISWWLYSGKKSLHNFHNFAMKLGIINEIPNMIIDKLVVKSTKWFVSVSRICAESLRTRSAFRNLNNIRYIYNGTGDDIITPSFDLKNKLGVEKGTSILMMLATYEERKGHRFIVDVFEKVWQQHPQSHLVFMGYGSDKEIGNLNVYINKKGLKGKISLLQYKPNAMEYLAQTDILLIGSQSLESFGLTAIEAMKYHKVVLTTNTGGLKEVVKDGEGGFVFDTNDVEGMAAKAIYLLQHPDEMNIQSGKGFLRYKNNFTAERVAKGYRELLLS